MTIVALGASLSYRDWLAFPDDGHQYEVVEGIAVVNPAPNTRHQVVSSRLHVVLSAAAPEPLLVLGAPIDWVLQPERPAHVRQPDLVVVHPDALDALAIRRPPLLAVEILSPSSHERDLVTKRHAYAAAGCAHYWIVDPDEPAIIAFTLVDGVFQESARARGSEPLVVDEPFAVRIMPAELRRGAPD